jgi:hypothetical protein
MVIPNSYWSVRYLENEPDKSTLKDSVSKKRLNYIYIVTKFAFKQMYLIKRIILRVLSNY